MKKYMIIGLLALMSCTMETSHNGDIDGFWQLTTVDTLSSGRSVDVKENGVFMAVQANLLEFRRPLEDSISMKYISVFFRFEHADGLLILSNPVANNRPIGDSLVLDVATIRPYGLNHLTETLHIEHLSAEKLILRNELLRMHFRKY